MNSLRDFISFRLMMKWTKWKLVLRQRLASWLENR